MEAILTKLENDGGQEKSQEVANDEQKQDAQ